MKIFCFCVLAVAAGAPSFTQNATPDTPALTVGAINKGLQFDWEPVPGASWYQLEYKAHKNSVFVQQGDDFDASITTTHYRFPLHLYDWTDARYRLAACNDAGCTRSAEVSVSALRRFAVGYFKPAKSLAGQGFGADTDFAANRVNFVSAAPDELIASGSGAKPGGAVYVFKFNGGFWRQRARLEPTIPPFINGKNVMKVAISADGYTVALGMPNYFHQQPADERSGEVFVFHSDGTKWTRTRISAGSRGLFGRWIGLNDAGDTLAIAHGVDSNPSTPPRIAIYRLVDGTWKPVRDIAGRAGHAEICDQGVLSADGSTVAESCEEGPYKSSPARVYVRTHSGDNWTKRADLPLQMSVASQFGYGHGGIGIDRTGNVVAAQVYALGPNPQDGPSEVHVFEREDGVYEREAVLTPGDWRSSAQRSSYGRSIAISGNGIVLAVGDALDNGLGYGPRAAPLLAGPSPTGAVYVYRYKEWWGLYNMVKPNYHPDDAPYLTFGTDVEFSDDGIAMLVGESGESSNAQGIDGNWQNLAAPGAGAVWLY